MFDSTSRRARLGVVRLSRNRHTRRPGAASAAASRTDRSNASRNRVAPPFNNARRRRRRRRLPAPIRAVSARRSSSRARVTVRAASKPPTNEDGTVFDAYAVLEVPDPASGHVIRESSWRCRRSTIPTCTPAMTRTHVREHQPRVRYPHRRPFARASGRRAPPRERRKTSRRRWKDDPLSRGYRGSHPGAPPRAHGRVRRRDPHACDVDVIDRMTESIREWGKMLAFTSELPLPFRCSATTSRGDCPRWSRTTAAPCGGGRAHHHRGHGGDESRRLTRRF